MYGSKLLNADYQQLIYTLTQTPYGFGWFIGENSQGAKTISYGGDTFGQTSLLQRQFAIQTLIIVLSNV